MVNYILLCEEKRLNELFMLVCNPVCRVMPCVLQCVRVLCCGRGCVVEGLCCGSGCVV